MRLKDDVDTGHFNADGESVWLLEGTGKPIDPRATAVRAWTEALIPKPPKIDDMVAGRPSGKAD